MSKANDPLLIHSRHRRHRKQVVGPAGSLPQVDAGPPVLLRRRVVNKEYEAERPGKRHVAVGQELVGQVLLVQRLSQLLGSARLMASIW